MNKSLFKGAVLETVLLNLINGEPGTGLHGYAISAAIERKFAVHLRPSALYPELKLLETRELVKSFWDVSDGRPIKRYKITEKGQTLLKQYALELKVLIQTASVHYCQVPSSIPQQV